MEFEIAQFRRRPPCVVSALLCAAAASLSPTHPGFAQTEQSAAPSQSTQLEEIVVTASRQGAQDVQKVPMAITVVNPTALDDLGMTGIEDYARLVPGLSMQELAPGLNRIDIRGIVTTSIDPTNVQDRSLVAIYYDETPITLQSSNPDLKVFDLERVEVLKGPQGTLYGAGAMAGTIRLITKKPDSNSFSGSFETTVSETAGGGDWSHGGTNYTLRGMLNIPITDYKAALRIVAYREFDSGFIDNVYTRVNPTVNGGQIIGLGENNANSYQTDQARAALRLTPTDSLTIDTSATFDHSNGADLNSGYPALGEYATSSLEHGLTYDNFELYNVTVGYDYDEGTHFTNSTSFLDRNIHSALPNEYGLLFIPGFINEFPFHPAYNAIHDKVHDIIEEARINSTDIENLKWTAGVFYENFTRHNYQDQPSTGMDAEIAQALGLPGYNSLDDGAFNPNDDFSGYQNINENQIALYAEATYTILPDLDLTAGLRYFDWRQKFGLYFGGIFGCTPCTSVGPNGNLVPGVPLHQYGDAGAKGVNPRFAVSYHVTNDVLVFAEAAKGFRYGGVNQPLPLAICLPYLEQLGLTSGPISFGPDKLWQYSLGEKSSLLDHRVTFNANAFYIMWNDVQTEQSLNCAYYFVENKGNITSKGVEFELTAKATPALTVSLNGAYTDAAADGNLVNINALNGDRAPYFPQYTASASATYEIPLQNDDAISLEGNLSFRGKSFNNFNPASFGYSELPSSTQLNFSINYLTSNYEFGLYGTNVTDGNKVINYQIDYYDVFFGPGTTPGRAATYARPRTFGLRAKVAF